MGEREVKGREGGRMGEDRGKKEKRGKVLGGQEKREGVWRAGEGEGDGRQEKGS